MCCADFHTSSGFKSKTWFYADVLVNNYKIFCVCCYEKSYDDCFHSEVSPNKSSHMEGLGIFMSFSNGHFLRLGTQAGLGHCGVGGVI